MLKKFHWLIASILIVSLGLNAATFCSAASLDDYEVRDFTADYYLSRDEKGISHLKVVEQITIDYLHPNTNHGIIRSIPFTNQDGDNLTTSSYHNLNIKVLRNGQPEPYQVEPIYKTYNSYFDVKIGDAKEYVYGTQTYTLEYEFERVITKFNPADYPTLNFAQKWQELYWDTNGTGWAQTFDKLTARVHIDDPTLRQAMSTDKWCYVGRSGSNDQSRCHIKTLTDGVEFSAQNLEYNENLTFVLTFANHTFTIPTNKPTDFSALFTIIAVIVIWFICYRLLTKCSRRNKSNLAARKKAFVAPQYLPPSDLTIAEAGLCYEGKITTKAKVATLLELAVNHKIQLINTEQTDKTQWSVRILTLDMQSWQEDILRILRGNDGELVAGEEFSIKNHPVSSALMRLSEKYDKQVTTKVKNKHLIKGNSNKSFNSRVGLGMIIFISTPFILAIIMQMPYYQANVLKCINYFGGEFLINLTCPVTLIALISLSCAAMFSGTLGVEYTDEGLKLLTYLDGLKLYIKMAEKERLEFLQSVENVQLDAAGIAKLYEKVLPYALLFGYETSWLKLLGKFYQDHSDLHHDWYHSSSTFDSVAFATSLHTLKSSTSSIMHRAEPVHSSSSSSGSHSSGSSSSSSGSSGGGHSGGGGGGGGGRGW